MKFSGTTASRSAVALSAGWLLGGAAIAMFTAPEASAADCSASGVSSTVSSVTGAAHQFLEGHPAANQVVTAAYGQSPAQAAGDIRRYFTANPGEYYELRGILTPIGDTQRQCNVTVLPPDLAAAYTMFMAG
ncbi:MAG TPA: hemophore-related protein [Mycobacterium sp.]|nr:hemophore-related protein [Mycobacterium sp.]